jgi:REP element-mobilizing transposase RayT
VSLARQCYLITTVTHDREPLFTRMDCARAVVQALRQANEDGSAHSHAFVIMPDHLHWLMSLGNGRHLSQVVRQVKGASSRKINALLQRRGVSVWQHGFHDHALRREEDLREVARYLVANPLRAGLVSSVGDYPWWDAEWL